MTPPTCVIPPTAAEVRRAETAIEKIRRDLERFDYVCTGTLLHRTKVCGKQECACARDSDARHGPYYEWTRREGPRLLHTVLPASAVPILRNAIANNRRLAGLIRAWERETITVALAREDE